MSDNTRALAELRPNATMPSRDEWGTITGMAAELLKSGFLPSTITQPAQAAAIMLKGRELGIPPMYALSNINVIKGKPVANAELMMSLVKRAYGPGAIWFEDTTNTSATVGYRLPGQTKDRFYTFSAADATQAQLSGDNWRKYPAAMLRARCVSAVCRMAFPEVIAGMYVPGELGDLVTVTDEGEVQSVGTYEDDTPAWSAPTKTNATVERIDPDTGAIEPEDDDERVSAMTALLRTADDNGITPDDIEVYFDRAGLDPETVTTARMRLIQEGISKNPVAFTETVEKHRIQMQMQQDPELNPTPEELGA
jgi:hypothetical protein